jgi:hypothetical protein
MKKIINFSWLVLWFIVIISCDKGFDELNTSKTAALALDPAFVLNNATLNSSPGGVSPGNATTALSYDFAIVQQVITSGSGVVAGGNWNQKNIGNTPLTWTNYYQNVVKYTNDVITRTKSDPQRANLYHMARIIQANAFMVLTDTYGDIPYTEAGAGYTAQIFLPKYDTQESIYNSIIQELTEASAALDPAGKIETSDVLYAGNIAKWKKFGYSLLLRAGMRLSKVNPALAQSTAAAAFAGGVILVNADNGVIAHDANFSNGIGNTVTGTEYATYYLAKPFVDALKSTNDPRLTSIAIRYVGAASGADQNTAINSPTPTLYTDKTAANQYGMPVGSDDNSANTAGASLPGGGKQFAFSQMDRNRFIKKTAPGYIVTAGQTNLLLAEAAIKNWIPGSFAQATIYYNAGITAHMNQMASYDANSAIAVSAITAYLAIPSNQLTPGTELAQIGYQYWIASFLDAPEAWANFRRTGFPTLAPNPYPGSEIPGNFIHRITYPPSEILVNSINVQNAITSMGGDNLDTRVWWDKP